jgi:hypothetical protein
MKKKLNGSFEYKDVEYDYTAVIYTGDDANYYPDQITDLDRADRDPIDEEDWELVEVVALQNAYLVEWCEKNGWEEEDSGGGCSALIKAGKNGTVTRITRADDPSAPQGMSEPVVIGQYEKDEQPVADPVLFMGGINEWIADPAASRWSPYADSIKKVATTLGRPYVNPRWIEAFMLLEHPSLNSISEESFDREVAVAINCIDFVGPKKAEQCAHSFGL